MVVYDLWKVTLYYMDAAMFKYGRIVGWTKIFQAAITATYGMMVSLVAMDTPTQQTQVGQQLGFSNLSKPCQEYDEYLYK